MGSIELAKLSPAMITKALDKIVNRGAPVHANKVLAALKQAFSYGVRRGAMTENPALYHCKAVILAGLRNHVFVI